MATAGTAPTERVKIQRVDGNGQPTGEVITAQFNPTSMQYTINNSAAEGSSRKRSRAVDESTAKLTLDLLFDTTDTGRDVRGDTEKIAKLMEPGGNRQTAVCQVTWGAFKFKGALDQYRETIDFFSSDGMPLRASLSLGFSSVPEKNKTPKEVFRFASGKKTSVTDGDVQASDEVYEVPVPETGSPSELANLTGDPSRARDIARDNGIEDIRSGSDVAATLLVADAPVLDGPVAFATGGAGFSASAGAGFSASAGAGFSASAGAGFSASAGAGFSASASAGVEISASASANASFRAGGRASAGVSASAGAFARLGVTARPAPARGPIDVVRILETAASVELTVDDVAAFGPGGRVLRRGGSSLDADVGASVSLRARIEFEE
jgi:hypothetical protein